MLYSPDLWNNSFKYWVVEIDCSLKMAQLCLPVSAVLVNVVYGGKNSKIAQILPLNHRTKKLCVDHAKVSPYFVLVCLWNRSLKEALFITWAVSDKDFFKVPFLFIWETPNVVLFVCFLMEAFTLTFFNLCMFCLSLRGSTVKWLRAKILKPHGLS